MNFFTFICQDQAANGRNTKGKILTLLFRAANYGSISRVAKFMLLPYQLFYKVVVDYLMGFELPYNVRAGQGLSIYHGQALVVHKNTVIGTYCTLRQSTTIGNNGKSEGCPVIGNHVNIGANVCIIGPVVIGDYVQIGAGSVVTKSIPAHAVAVGNPARVIRRHVPESNLVSAC